MTQLFVSWVINANSLKPARFGNSVLDFEEPEWRLDIQKIENKLYNDLPEGQRSVSDWPTVLFFHVLRGP